MIEMSDIPGYEGLYAITKDGKVWSYPKFKGVSKKKLTIGKWLKISISTHGYPFVAFKNKYHSIHRLLAITFIPNPENKPWINHKNADRADNRLENLEWCTPSENNLHTFRLGRKKALGGFGRIGKKHYRSQGFLIRDLFGNEVYYESSRQFQLATGFHQTCIRDAKRRKINSYTFTQGRIKGLTVIFKMD